MLPHTIQTKEIFIVWEVLWNKIKHKEYIFYEIALSIKKFNLLLNNVEKILAIEGILACQGIDRQRPFKSTPVAETIYNKIRKVVPFVDVEENEIGKEIEKIANAIRNNELV